MNIVTVVGARPQFIKAFPVSKEIRKNHKETVIHTGQHYDHGMSSLFFDELGMAEPDINLSVGSDSHGRQIARMLEGLEEKFLKIKPDIVIVYGDTNSTISAALAASKLGIDVAHIEAGMRCGDLTMPEEVNRLVTDRVSRLLFCSTESAVENLRSEGIKDGIHLVGDVMVDAVYLSIPLIEQKLELLDRLELKKGHFVYCTVHRASNTQRKSLQSIVEALTQIRSTVVFPVHPRTAKELDEAGLMSSLRDSPHVRLIEPVSYLESLLLQRNAQSVLTDSGGIQKEAYLLGVPCLTLRDSTEWPETVEAGWNLLVGNEPARILEGISKFKPVGDRPELFGDGKASQKIVALLDVTETSR